MDGDALYGDGHHGGMTFWEGQEWESRKQVLIILSLKYLLDEQVEIFTSQLKMGIGSSMEK